MKDSDKGLSQKSNSASYRLNLIREAGGWVNIIKKEAPSYF